MMGKATSGVTGSLSDIIQAIAAAAADFGREADHDEIMDLVKDMAVSVNSVGWTDVIAY